MRLFILLCPVFAEAHGPFVAGHWLWRCGTRVSLVVSRRLVAPGHVGSYFPDQRSNLCPCFVRWILNHQITKDIPWYHFDHPKELWAGCRDTWKGWQPIATGPCLMSFSGKLEYDFFFLSNSQLLSSALCWSVFGWKQRFKTIPIEYVVDLKSRGRMANILGDRIQ